METVRVSVGPEAARGREVLFFVRTGSKRAPIASLADNNGFPAVREFYVKGFEHRGEEGVRVHIFFEGSANGEGIAINIAQPDMPGDKTVIPLV